MSYSATELKKFILEQYKIRKTAKVEYEKLLKETENKIKAYENDLNLIFNNLSTEVIELAKSTITVKGKYTKRGDQPSVVTDFIEWIVTGHTENYYNPPKVTFGTKNYDCFSSQRCDCAWGYGPRHGSINFQIGINRNRDIAKNPLTLEEKDACLYYLHHLEEIQRIEEESKSLVLSQ